MKPRSGVRSDWSYCHSYLKNLRPKPLPMWLDLRMQRMFICTAAAFCMMCHMLTMMWKLFQIDCCHMTAQRVPIGIQAWAPLGSLGEGELVA